jgi:hypothetical protein
MELLPGHSAFCTTTRALNSSSADEESHDSAAYPQQSAAPAFPPRAACSVSRDMPCHLPLHDCLGLALRKCLKPLHLSVGDKEVRVTRCVGNEYRRSYGRHGSLNRNAVTVWHQQRNAMTATACAPKCRQLELHIVVDDTRAKFRGDAVHYFVCICHWLRRPSASAPNEAVSKVYHAASSVLS